MAVFYWHEIFFNNCSLILMIALPHMGMAKTPLWNAQGDNITGTQIKQPRGEKKTTT